MICHSATGNRQCSFTPPCHHTCCYVMPFPTLTSLAKVYLFFSFILSIPLELLIQIEMLFSCRGLLLYFAYIPTDIIIRVFDAYWTCHIWDQGIWNYSGSAERPSLTITSEVAPPPSITLYLLNRINFLHSTSHFVALYLAFISLFSCLLFTSTTIMYIPQKQGL